MRARIYQPARTAMSSGTAKTKHWVLEFAQTSAREVDPLPTTGSKPRCKSPKSARQISALVATAKTLRPTAVGLGPIDLP